MNDSPEPDSFEKHLRFGCGFTLGGLVALFCIPREVAALVSPASAGAAGFALIAGFPAMRYGDDFWRSISNWFRF